MVGIGLLAIASIPQPQLHKSQDHLPEIKPGINIRQLWQELSLQDPDGLRLNHLTFYDLAFGRGWSESRNILGL